MSARYVYVPESEREKRLLEQIESLRALLIRAADALEGKPVYDALANLRLIDELRKAAL